MLLEGYDPIHQQMYLGVSLLSAVSSVPINELVPIFGSQRNLMLVRIGNWNFYSASRQTF